jgi:hypothetical protein
MGGSNSETISGLRFHINDSEGRVHIHDDVSKLKFEMDKDDFRTDMKDALESMKKSSMVTVINGKTRTSLYLMNDGGAISLFLSDGSSVKTELEKFLRGC